jgi:shikimate kinase
VLVGAPGSGKTTVGRALAGRLGVAFRDTDDDVAARAGQAVADILVDHGAGRVQELELGAVQRALDEHDGVLGVGSGAVEIPRVRELLAAHRVIFLDVGVADAARRTGMDTVRPVHLGNVRAQLKQLLDARRPLYAEVATATVVTDGCSVDEVVAAALAAEPAGNAHAG